MAASPGNRDLDVRPGVARDPTHEWGRAQAGVELRPELGHSPHALSDSRLAHRLGQPGSRAAGQPAHQAPRAG